MKWGNKSRGFGRDNRRGGRSGGGRFSERAEMFDAICSECGNKCQVPFEPTGSKPVYCSDCFERQGGGSRERRSFRGDRDFNRRDDRGFRGDRTSQPSRSVTPEQIEEINDKLNHILTILSNVVPRKSDSDDTSFQFDERKTVRTENEDPLSLE